MPQVRAFCRKVLSLFPLFYFSSLAITQFGLLSHVSSLRLSLGHAGPALTLSNAARASQFSPTCWWYASIWATSPLGVAVRHVLGGFYLFIYLFFVLVILPSEIPKLPTDPLVRRFPGVWKLLFFYNSLTFLSLFLSFIFCPVSF